MNTTADVPVFDRLSTLSDPTRARLLALLEEHEFAVGELAQVLQVAQPSVSRHLKVLSDAGWTSWRQEGTSRYYRMSEDLPDEQRSLWEVVCPGLALMAVTGEDRERAASVLGAREERSRAFFSETAEQWEEVRERLYGRGAELLPLFGLLDPAWVVADLGAGTGALARALAPHVRKVVAVDRSPEMLRTARRRLEVAEGLAPGGGEIDLRPGELDDLPLSDGEVDLAVLSLVLHHVADPAAVLAEAARVLRPGGRLLLVDMRPHGRSGYGETMGHLWSGFEPTRVEAWLAAAGLRDGRVRPLPADPSAEGPLLFVAGAVR